MPKKFTVEKDAWLTKQMAVDSYAIKLSQDAKSEGAYVLPEELKKDCMAYVKVPVTDLESCNAFEDIGFSLVDTSVRYEKNVSTHDFEIKYSRWAEAYDQEAIAEVAVNSFKYSRFHMDPLIENETADQIKAAWTDSFYEGTRGQRMVVAELDGVAVGFLQLLDLDESQMVIDLIAVSSGHRGIGLARDMINFTLSQSPDCMLIKVGTQLSNIPSLRLYNSMGFEHYSSYYVFHYHFDANS